MTEPNERSDPVEGFTDVTPEQLDALHTQCHRTVCEGYMKAQAARAIERSTGSLERLTAALNDVTETARAWTQHMQGRNPWGHVEVARERVQAPEEPLAEWERELLEGAAREGSLVESAWTADEQHRANLRAGLQHQRISPTFVL